MLNDISIWYIIVWTLIHILCPNILESEIDTFKQETSNLKSLQEKIEKERTSLHQKHKDLKKQKANDEIQMERRMQRLKQEKMLLERMKKGAERNVESMHLFFYFSIYSFYLFVSL